MKVYLVEEWDGECSAVMGVFSTQELAEAAVEELKERNKGRGMDYAVTAYAVDGD